MSLLQLSVVMSYALIAAVAVTDPSVTVSRRPGSSETTTFVKELKGIKINASIITSLVENANVTSLFQLVDTPVDDLVTNCGFTEQNAAKLLKQAKGLKRYGDGQIDKWVKSETKLKKKVEKVEGRVYTPYCLAPTFSFYDKKAEHCLVFGNYETKGLNLDGVLRKSHTDTERGKVYRK